MKYYRINGTLHAPMMIKEDRQSSTSGGLSWLPGSTLRGALAARYFRTGGLAGDKEFRSLFLNNPIFFPNLFPLGSGANPVSRILPLTAGSCKRNPGFKSQKKERHGVSDLLALKWIQRQFPGRDVSISCLFQGCDNDMKGFSGFWNGDTVSPCHHSPAMSYQRHTGIDRVTGTIANRIFYITQAVDDYQKDTDAPSEFEAFFQQRLSGDLYLEEEQVSLLEPLISENIFVGADRTSGMGEIELALSEADDLSGLDLAAWDSAFMKRVKAVSAHALTEKEIEANRSGLLFSVKLESDAILVDEFLRPTSELELGFDQVKYVMKVAGAKVVRGWNAAWGLPKQDEQAVAMGSVYLFCYEGNDLEELERFLVDLKVKGIGLRREEGFGRISVCEPLHIVEEVI